jgi:nitrogen fixation/metabolism regulation signal transduction histidine kinase
LPNTDVTVPDHQILQADFFQRANGLEFRSFLETLPLAAYTCDAHGLITYFNQLAVEAWGRKPQLNNPADHFCGSFKMFSADGSPIPHSECWMALALREKRGYNECEVVVERPDGSRCTVLAHANPFFDKTGRIVGAVNILVDISDRKRAEEAERQTSRRKDEFLAMLARELRNPLGPLRNALQLVKHPTVDAATVSGMWDVMDRQVGNLTRLVDDLLDVARVTRGRIEMRKAVVDLAIIVRQAVKSMELIVAERAQELLLSVVESPLYVEADSTRMEQVFGNLLNNASKFSPERAPIWVTVELECDEGRITADSVVVGIRDDGRRGTRSAASPTPLLRLSG